MCLEEKSNRLLQHHSILSSYYAYKKMPPNYNMKIVFLIVNKTMNRDTR